MDLSLAWVRWRPFMALRGETANEHEHEHEHEHEDEDEDEDDCVPNTRTPKGIHHRGTENAKVRMDSSLAWV